MIKFDLHIHSSASKYKEDSTIVNNSTPENASCLLEKLNLYNVALFSITDHNRFDVQLYCKLDELMKTKRDKYPFVKGLVAGVEFDVQIDDDMGKCHIITIFDAKNNVDNYNKINSALSNNLIKDKQEAYSRKDFEALLKEIGLNVILIACQRSGLDRQDGKHNSFSESARDPKALLKTGYIDALEFQKPNVEGILRNNLHDMPRQVGLVMGSDCHEWSEYPYHDKNSKNKSFTHSRASILPTFKGLLMAMTSPETRINRQENSNPHYIQEMRINGSVIPLVNGLNVIIGENGAGKSTLLKVLNQSIKKKYEKDIVSKNSISASTVDKSYIEYIGQGDIVRKFSEKSLFPEANFLEVDHSEFTEAYKKYAADIMTYINHNISAKEALDVLNNQNISYNDVLESTNYFINVKIESDYEKVNNPHFNEERIFKRIIEDIKKLSQKPYYNEYANELTQMIHVGEKIYNEIRAKNQQKIIESEIKNAIVSACNDYLVKVHRASSSRENDKRDFEQKRRTFVDQVTKAILLNTRQKPFPNAPDSIKGMSSNNKSGFKFNCEAKYNERDVKIEFFEQIFTKDYANANKIKAIKSKDEFSKAIRYCTDISKISEQYNKNVQAFIDTQTDCKKFIVDGSNENLGNTLGEMSLAYFNYMTKYYEDHSVYLIDQPEDNISNNNISKKLLSYFNSIRYKKQIIMVTHNPLLVVNQDADQVVFVKKHHDKVEAAYGCLERESAGINILNIIADNMDGGRSSIEKRLKVYGKDHITVNEG